ncbi:unnamed protein product [Zymoseptoria tritici ST99CH_1A5]|uniref:RRM domain-containing protein n=1 Tax=Zymoseptoria tritici ST99CH_1A5 TaxID=1276529 RepID=A0A1Y6LP81_ZYMTR|nr:unnamed protein product [Zymoseptoria tritici ST99CH_1A5]
MHTTISSSHQRPGRRTSDKQNESENTAAQARANHSNARSRPELSAIAQPFPQYSAQNLQHTHQPLDLLAPRSAGAMSFAPSDTGADAGGNDGMDQEQNSNIYRPPHRRSEPTPMERHDSSASRMAHGSGNMHNQYAQQMSATQHGPPFANPASIPPGYNHSTHGAYPVPYEYTPQFPRHGQAGGPPQVFDPNTMQYDHHMQGFRNYANQSYFFPQGNQSNFNNINTSSNPANNFQGFGGQHNYPQSAQAYGFSQSATGASPNNVGFTQETNVQRGMYPQGHMIRQDIGSTQSSTSAHDAGASSSSTAPQTHNHGHNTIVYGDRAASVNAAPHTQHSQSRNTESDGASSGLGAGLKDLANSLPQTPSQALVRTDDGSNVGHRSRANTNGSPQKRLRAQSDRSSVTNIQPFNASSNRTVAGMSNPVHAHKQSQSISSGSGQIQSFNTPNHRRVSGMIEPSHGRMHSNSNSDGPYNPMPRDMPNHHRMGSANHRGRYGSISQGAGYNSMPGPIAMPTQVNLRNDSVTSATGTSGLGAHQLAKLIMSGATEDPYDSSMKRYDTPERQAPPTLGPARFNESTMFSQPMPMPANRSTPRSRNQSSGVGLGPVPDVTPPDWLPLAWQSLCVPTMEETWDSLPLGELYREVTHSMCSVLRIKDIPYTCTRQEIVAFMGGKAQIARQPDGSPWHAVHIIMERETGKTMDCFVELTSEAEAIYQCDQFRRRAEAGRPPRVGERVVQVVLSSQDELLSELFPRAKHVRWNDGCPIIDTEPKYYYPSIQASGFQGFLHPEEFFTMNRHAETNERAIFASKSPSRVYETLISVLYKYPWYAVDYVSVRERDALFDCIYHLLNCLMYELSKDKQDRKASPLDVTPALLQELASAMLVCVGFCDSQKFMVVEALHQNGYSGIAAGEGAHLRLGGQHQYCASWPFVSLCVKPGVAMELLSYYALMLRTATIDADPSQALEDAMPMGNIEIDYGPDYQQSSLATVAVMEYDYLKMVLSKYLQDHHQQVNDLADHGNILPIGQNDSAEQMARANIQSQQGQLFVPTGAHGSVPPSPFVSEDGFYSQAGSASTL